jgi:exonuclease III
MSNIKIGSVNVRGLADPVKRRDVFLWLKEKDLDIVCLQDVHFRGN